MGDAAMKTRFFYIVGIIMLLLIIVIAAAAASGPRKPSNPKGKAVCTVSSGIGLQSVLITVSGSSAVKSIIKTAADLPYSFNYTIGDQLTLNFTTLPDYKWNACTFGDGTFDNNNPLIIRPTTDLTIMAQCLSRSITT
jgi:hypothetical protein